MKVLKNFSCNGVRKKAGEILSNKEKEIIGEKFGKKLIHDDFLQNIEVEPKQKKDKQRKDK